MRKLTCNPDVEVIGNAVLAFANNLQAGEVEQFLAKEGLVDVQPDEWYSAQSYLAALNDLIAMPNMVTNFVSIGMAIAAQIPVPPELENGPLSTILNMWDDLYQAQHRGGDIGHVYIEKISKTHYRTVHKHIYPDDMVYGLAYGWCRRFLPAGTSFVVEYEELDNRLDSGDNDETVVIIKWD